MAITCPLLSDSLPHRLLVTAGYTTLQEKVATAAIHDSIDVVDPPKCHPNTRVAIIQSIIDWAKGVADEEINQKSMIWLNGSAGAGKSAIARSVAERCSEQGLLLGSFFFAAGMGRMGGDSNRSNEKAVEQGTKQQMDVKKKANGKGDSDLSLYPVHARCTIMALLGFVGPFPSLPFTQLVEPFRHLDYLQSELITTNMCHLDPCLLISFLRYLLQPSPTHQPLLAVLSSRYHIHQLDGCWNVLLAQPLFQHSVRPTPMIVADSYVDENESIESRLHIL
ncbi:hypothetical protein CPC08DRAFT_767691 [Agrocybe pediades]|nr:hypothetical protein CPC08DRAFT_767691 [Agrocybe pediades]